MTRLSGKEIGRVERALGLLDEDARVKVARRIHDVATQYLQESEDSYSALGPTTELMATWTLAMQADTVFSLAELIRPLSLAEKERTEQLNWAVSPGTTGEAGQAGEEDDARKWEAIFASHYPNYSVSFFVAADPSSGHSGYVEMKFGSEGQIHRIFMDKNAILDWGLGLGFLASSALRPEGTETIRRDYEEGEGESAA